MFGKFSVLFEHMVYIIATVDTFPNVTMPMHCSLVVLFDHSSCVAIGSLTLRFEVTNFFCDANDVIKTSVTTTTSARNDKNNITE